MATSFFAFDREAALFGPMRRAALQRDLKNRFESGEHAAEELVAELGAASYVPSSASTGTFATRATS